MKDWMGNEIKEGQIIFWVQVVPPFLSEGYKINPDGSREVIKFFDPENYWAPGRREYVVEEEGVLYGVFQTDWEGEIKEKLDSTRATRYQEILCIEGISDNKEEYYKSKQE